MLDSTYIGLDVHVRSICASALVVETGEVVRSSFGYDADAVARWCKRLPQPVKCVYESGPTGFDLQRKLEAAGVPCVVGAVSKMVRPSGDRVKTDRRDASFLARMLAVGNVVGVAVPTEAQEAARDLTRAREDCREDLMRARHLLSKFLLRKGIVYDAGKTAWTRTHRAWLRGLEFADPNERLVFDEYLAGVEALEQRRDRLDGAIREQAALPEWSPVVARVSALRGISTLTAFSMAAEIGDFSRFPNARSPMPCVGLVPSESSSGESVSRGQITKTGNGHVRRLLVESAWAHARRWSPALEAERERTSALTPRAAAKAKRANRRLHERYVALSGRRKHANVVKVAVARELAGFVWALATDAD